MLTLAQQWEKHRVPLINQYRELKATSEVYQVIKAAYIHVKLHFNRFLYCIGLSCSGLVSCRVSDQSESEKYLDEIRRLQARMKEAAADTRSKEDLHKQLVRPVSFTCCTA